MHCDGGGQVVLELGMTRLRLLSEPNQALRRVSRATSVGGWNGPDRMRPGGRAPSASHTATQGRRRYVCIRTRAVLQTGTRAPHAAICVTTAEWADPRARARGTWPLLSGGSSARGGLGV